MKSTHSPELGNRLRARSTLWASLGLILAVALGLRIWAGVGVAFTRGDARAAEAAISGSWRDAIALSVMDGRLVLSPLLLRACAGALGAADVALIAPGVLFGIAACALLYAFERNAGRRRSALLAAGLGALSSCWIAASLRPGPVALYPVLTTGLLVAGMRVLRGEFSWKWTHFAYALLLALGCPLGWLLALVLPVVARMTFPRTETRVCRELERSTGWALLAGAPILLLRVAVFAMVGPSAEGGVADARLIREGLGDVIGNLAPLVAAVAIAALLHGVVRIYRRGRLPGIAWETFLRVALPRDRLLVACWAGVSVALTAGGSWIFQEWKFGDLVGVSPALFLLLSAAIAWGWKAGKGWERRAARLALVLGAAGTVGMSVAGIRERVASSNAKLAMATISDRLRPSDVVAVLSWSGASEIRRQLPGGVRLVAMPWGDAGDPRQWAGVAEAMRQPMNLDLFLKAIVRQARPEGRVWVFDAWKGTLGGYLIQRDVEFLDVRAQPFYGSAWRYLDDEESARFDPAAVSRETMYLEAWRGVELDHRLRALLTRRSIRLAENDPVRSVWEGSRFVVTEFAVPRKIK